MEIWDVGKFTLPSFRASEQHRTARVKIPIVKKWCCGGVFRKETQTCHFGGSSWSVQPFCSTDFSCRTPHATGLLQLFSTNFRGKLHVDFGVGIQQTRLLRGNTCFSKCSKEDQNISGWHLRMLNQEPLTDTIYQNKRIWSEIPSCYRKVWVWRCFQRGLDLSAWNEIDTIYTFLLHFHLSRVLQEPWPEQYLSS